MRHLPKLVKFFESQIRGSHDVSYVAPLCVRRIDCVPSSGDQGLPATQFNNYFYASISCMHMPREAIVGINLENDRAEA